MHVRNLAPSHGAKIIICFYGEIYLYLILKMQELRAGFTAKCVNALKHCSTISSERLCETGMLLLSPLSR